MIPRPPFIRAQKRLARRISEWCLTSFFCCVALAALWLLFVLSLATCEPVRR